MDSVEEMSKRTNTPAGQVLTFLIKILQQETMESMAKHAGTKVIFFDKSTGEKVTRESIL